MNQIYLLIIVMFFMGFYSNAEEATPDKTTGLEHAADQLEENAASKKNPKASEVLQRNAERKRLKAAEKAEKKAEKNADKAEKKEAKKKKKQEKRLAKMDRKQDKMARKAEKKAEKMRRKQERRKRKGK